MDEHQGFEERIRKLDERIRETEIRQRLLVDAIARVAELVDPDFRSFSLLALISGFRGKDIEEMQHFFEEWVINHLPDEENGREKFVQEFTRRFPQYAHLLEAIVQAYQADGLLPQLTRLILE